MVKTSRGTKPLSKLVIVESPAKAATIAKFLGPNYKVVASYGHVRDLPGKAHEVPEEIRGQKWARLAVNITENFQPYYVIPADKTKRIAELKRALKDADEILLATDEDREGESISWHLLQVLKPKVPVRRITFNEITKTAITHAVANPRDIDDALVRAQEGRRILDRLFGYELSPVLWKKVRTGLSAGRVQSVALRLVVEREEERMAFHKSAYWDVEAVLREGATEFTATLTRHGDQRVVGSKDFDSTTGLLKKEDTSNLLWLREEAEVRKLTEEYLAADPWRVVSVEQKEVAQRPYPPFTTSTLQQGAAAVLGMSIKRTMSVAQKLYEGMDLGSRQREGLITYMRTDSMSMSEKAIQEAGDLIKSKFGEDYYNGARRYKTKSKTAQEAHEAIRPTNFDNTPEQLRGVLDREEWALYDLIWRRAIASQMPDARIARTAADIAAGQGTFHATGSVVRFDGFLKVLSGGQRDTVLPPMHEGQLIHRAPAGKASPAELAYTDAIPKPHETAPPPRYTEGSLVKKLEEEGIGRPSTYAAVITTIQARDYVSKKGSALVPSFVGMAVTDLLRRHFGEFVSVGFTARMEEALDNIAEGNVDSIDFLRSFYRGGGDFGNGLEPSIKLELPQIEFPAIALGTDPDTGDAISVRVGKISPFLQRGEGGDGNTATVPADTSPDEMTIERAMELLKSKADGKIPIGEHPETGESIYVLDGPLGPYVQLGKPEGKTKPRRASLPEGTTRDTMTIAEAVRLLSLPRQLGEHPETGKVISAAIGRFGPYIVHDGDFRSLKPKEGDDPYTVTLDRALELLSQPKGVRGSTKTVLRDLGKHPENDKSLQIMDGKYGAYVTDGDHNATIPKGTPVEQVTVAQALELLAEAALKKPAKKKAAPRAKKAATGTKKKTATATKKKAAPRKTAAKKPVRKTKSE
jgi:DNA topoisomerase-1